MALSGGNRSLLMRNCLTFGEGRVTLEIPECNWSDSLLRIRNKGDAVHAGMGERQRRFVHHAFGGDALAFARGTEESFAAFSEDSWFGQCAAKRGVFMRMKRFSEDLRS